MTGSFYVYLLANIHRSLYVGVTNDLTRRLLEHQGRFAPGHTSTYGINRLVYFEETTDVLAAIVRERQIKGWVRRKKVALIERDNADWHDLTATLFDAE